MSERKERCETCRFWEDDRKLADDGWARGQCRHRAPLLMEAHFSEIFSGGWEGDAHLHMIRDALTRVFPLTFSDDWCGEWQDGRASELDQTPLEEKAFSVRAWNILSRDFMDEEPIDTLGKLANCTARQLLDRRNLGERVLEEIRRYLAKRGLTLRGESQPEVTPPES